MRRFAPHFTVKFFRFPWKADIYSVIAYYLSHRHEIDNYLERRNQKAQQLRQQLTQKHNLVDLRQRLLNRQAQKESRQNALSK